jgi:hypothetical protein
LVLLLIVADRWDASERAWCPAAAGTVALVICCVWFKEAALAFLPGLVLWLAWRRRWWPAVVTGVAGIASLTPIVIGRLSTGVPVAGARYTSELGSYYSGGWLHRIALVPLGLGEWFFDALPSAIVRTGSPLSNQTALFVVFRALACGTTGLLVVVGTVTWLRRRGADLAFFVMLAYVGEVSLYKYVNDRRALLLLPILLTWYVIGVAQAYRWLADRAASLATLARWRQGFALYGVLAVAGPLAAQFPTDYRFALGQNSSAPASSPYMDLLSQLGNPSQVVETTYLWSTALLSDHATDNVAAIDSTADCDPVAVPGELRADEAAYLLTAAIDTPGQVDSPCLQKVASGAAWAVPLLETPVDDATVYELVGPQSAQPDLDALLSIGSATLSLPHQPARPSLSSAPSLSAPSLSSSRQAPAVWRWTIPSDSTVRQVSVGQVMATSGPTGAVSLRLLEGTHWRIVASAPGAVGPGGLDPYLLATLPSGRQASAVELTVDARGPVEIGDLAVLGGPGRRVPSTRVG